MARSYHVEIARYAANVDRKWIDNLLSHFDIPGVEGGRQGVARRVSAAAIHHIALVHQIASELDLPLARAVALATHLLADGAPDLPLTPWLALRFDRDAFRRDVDAAIAEAVESVVPPRRGRPPSR